MGFEDRSQMQFRLPPDQMRRLTQAAKYRGQTKQSFVQEVVLAEIAAIEENRRVKRSVKENDDERPQKKTEPVTGIGLGLGNLFNEHRPLSEPESPPVSTSPVIVHVGNGASPGGDIIERLAAYVASGRDFERGTRLRTAVGILHASASSDEERRSLAARLDEAVAVKVKATDNGILKAARITFDKLTGIFGGNE